VLQHPQMYAISQVYRACGSTWETCIRMPVSRCGHAVVVPPRMHRGGLLPNLKRIVTFAVTGWAMHSPPAAGWAWITRSASDHADYDELFERSSGCSRA